LAAILHLFIVLQTEDSLRSAAQQIRQHVCATYSFNFNILNSEYK
jgi:hypothetical protein